ncbi:DUF1707 domain-containing protein [Actinoplanes sp. NPDC049681]|uniref:DUF1707 domain-containing protein n=1 Tax=Actinoplanes sp. NPDC049681 TaxID=3363905 RepID=UPI0037B02B87
MRAADADRQAVADQLRVALDEGRLELHEYDERLQRAYAAKTYGELGGLLTDLPAATVPDASPVVTASDRELRRRWLAHVWGSWLPVVGTMVAIWAVTCLAAGELTYFWPVWVAVAWGIGPVIATTSGLATGEPRRWAEKKVRKERARQLKRERRALRAEAIARGELPAGAAPVKEPKNTH